MEYFPKRLPEFRVEDGVNDRIEERVDVAQPRGQDEHGDSWVEGEANLVADGAKDGAREERRPAEEEDT